MSKRIELTVGDGYSTFVMMNSDFYGVLLYYAYTLNQNMALELYKATISEYQYKLAYDLPLGNLTELNEEVFISLNQLPPLISFIENQILPTLNNMNPNQDITQIWGVGNSLESFLGSKGEFFLKFGIDDIEVRAYPIIDLIDKYLNILNFFQYVSNYNVRYNVSIG